MPGIASEVRQSPAAFKVRQSLQDRVLGIRSVTSATSIPCWPQTVIFRVLHEVGEALMGPNSTRHDTAASAKTANGRPSGGGFTREGERDDGAVQVGKIVRVLVKNHTEE